MISGKQLSLTDSLIVESQELVKDTAGGTIDLITTDGVVIMNNLPSCVNERRLLTYSEWVEQSFDGDLDQLLSFKCAKLITVAGDDDAHKGRNYIIG